MSKVLNLCVVVGIAGAFAATASGDILGSAGSFAVLGGSTVTNTGPSTIVGDLGVWPGLAITGFPPGVVVAGAIHAGDGPAQQAQHDATAAYDSLSAMARTATLTGVDLGGLTLEPGVYFFDSAAQLTGTLRLDAMGRPGAVFVFQIGSTLISASGSSVVTINGADGCDVYWRVGSSATLGSDTNFTGSILAQASITLNTRASIVEGRALALNGAVTLDSNQISAACVPGPGAASALALACGGALAQRRRR